MTVHVVLADPPREGLVLTGLAAAAPISEAEAADLYAAMVSDALRAVAASGGDLIVNYRDDDDLPPEYRTETSPEAELRGLARQALDDPDEARFEVQVGSTFDARVGNVVTHLLREEDADSVAVLDPRTPTIARTDLDNAAMKLRRSDVVIGPAPGGRVYYLGVTDPLDFAGAYDPPEVRTLAERGVEAGGHVDFLPMHPTVETASDLVTLVSVLAARRAADRVVPAFTADAVDRFGLSVVVEDGERRIVRETDAP